MRKSPRWCLQCQASATRWHTAPTVQAHSLRKCVTVPPWPNTHSSCSPGSPVSTAQEAVFGEACETPHHMVELCPPFLLGTHQQDLTHPEKTLWPGRVLHPLRCMCPSWTPSFHDETCCPGEAQCRRGKTVPDCTVRGLHS